MATIKTIDNKKIDIQDIRWFGNEVEKTYRKDGVFKSFQFKSWIKTHKGKLYYVKDKIGTLKKLFLKFYSQKKKVVEFKDSKKKIAYSWECEVLDDDSGEKLIESEIEKAHNAVKNHKSFSFDGKHMYFYVEERIFKDSRNSNLVYIDIDKNLIIPIDIELPYTRVKINEWLDRYQNK